MGPDDGGALVIPAPSVEARTHSIFCRISPAREPVNDHSQDAVFDAAKRVLDLGYTVRTVQQRDRGLIA